jgi:hypothetical protein
MIEKLAKVESAGLNYTDRGILTMNIVVHYEEGCHQNICNLILDSWSPDEVFCVDDIHKLQGIYLWVIGEGEGLSFSPKGFRPLSVDSKYRKGKVIYKDIFGG